MLRKRLRIGIYACWAILSLVLVVDIVDSLIVGDAILHVIVYIIISAGLIRWSGKLAAVPEDQGPDP